MKSKIKPAILIFACFLACVIPLSGPDKASTHPIEELVKQQSLGAAAEKDYVKKALKDRMWINAIFSFIKDFETDKKQASVKSPAELTYGEPVKVYFTDENVIQALIDDRPLTGLIKQCPHYWNFPILNAKKELIASFRVELNKGRWAIFEVSSGKPPESLITANNPIRISDLFTVKGIKEGESYVVFDCPVSGADFLLVQSGINENLIPLIYEPAIKSEGRSSFNGLKQGHTYSRHQVSAAIGPDLKEPGGCLVSPGISTEVQAELRNYLYAIAFLTIVLVLLIIAYRKMNR